MEELVNQISAVARGVWKYRWPGVVVAWAVAIIGAVVVMRLPDRYEATAQIYVDTQSILKPLMSGLAVQPNVDQQVIMLSRTLITRPNIEKLIRMADLDLQKSSKVQQDLMVDELIKTLEIKTTGRDNLYFLSFRDSEADKAKRVIQSLVSIFVESSLGASRKDTDTAKVFINEQIKSYQTKLEEAEARLKAFRLRNLDLQTADGRDSAGRLADFSAQLDKAKLDLREAENARTAAKAALDQEKSQSAGTAAQSLLQESAIQVSTPEIDGRIEVQKRNLDNLLQRYTDQHPDVVSTRRLLKDLEEQKAKEAAELRKTAMAASSPGAGMSQSLAYQELHRMVATADVQVAALKARVGEYASRYQNAREALKTAPQLEAEAAQLNRDYEIHKKNYQDLVSRREAASMSGDLEVASGLADFRLIEPPRVSPKPVWPNRLALLPLALLVALAAGAFTAFAISQLRPVFYKASDMRSKIDVPLLGVVSAMLSGADRQLERRDRMRFVFASGSLVVLFTAGLTAMFILSTR
jgi:polysaccharide chain length determinant protein (PEP-CTERM system associated)